MKRLLLIFTLALGLIGCDLNNNANPNSASEEAVLKTSEGIQALAIGMQQYYATQTLAAAVYVPAVASGELGCNTTFSDALDLHIGGAGLPNTNGHILAIWSRSFRVIEMANKLMANVPNVQLADGTRSGILALAELYKAMSLGALAGAFEQAPIDTDPTGQAAFKTRAQVLTEAIRLLDDAAAKLTATPASAEFNAKILGTGFDLTNTIHVMRARYNLFAGNHTAALAAANLVDLSKKSVFTFDDKNNNPLFNQIANAGNTTRNWAPRDNLGITPEAGDARIAFWTATVTRSSTAAPTVPLDDVKGFYDTMIKAIPVYLPSEVRLIRAEANARLAKPAADVLADIDAVRTKKAVDDPFGLGAGLAAYAGATTQTALLDEIFRQRTVELFLQGVRLEDSRRFGRPAAERNRTFLPYPNQERINNANTPADPTN